MPTVKIKIDDQELQVPAGRTVIQAAHEAGITIPYYCYHPGLVPDGNCRICLVEIEKAPKLAVACKTPVADGMVVRTNTDKVNAARKGVMEFILVNHPIDCPVCDQAGECKLQDYYYDYDLQQSRFKEAKQHKPKVQQFGQHVMFDGERCIMCSRCVRFTRDVSRSNELGLFNRGDRTVISMPDGVTLDNPYSMNVIDICPVGALTSHDFRFRKRVWLLDEKPSVCTGCSRGCASLVDVSENENKAYRVRGRKNLDVNTYWMCDDGRFVHMRYEKNRLTLPLVGGQTADMGVAIDAAAQKIRAAIGDGGAASVCVLLSPQLSCEDAYAVKEVLIDGLGAQFSIAHGQAADGYQVEQDGFLMMADKNPNRAGLRIVLGGDGLSTAELDAKVAAGKIRLLVSIGANVSQEVPSHGKLTSVVALTWFIPGVAVEAYPGSYPHVLPKADTAKIDVAVPLASPLESASVFINQDGVAQMSAAALKAPGAALSACAFAHRLAGRVGVTGIEGDGLTRMLSGVAALKGLDKTLLGAGHHQKLQTVGA